MKSTKTLATTVGIGLVGAAAGAVLASRDPWLLSSSLPRSVPVETDEGELPAAADVVVIGGGISGITTALYLNEFGLSTVVLEKGYVGGEASSRNFGWVYTSGFHPDILPLAVLAKREWQSYQGRFGRDISFRAAGNTMFIESEQELGGFEEWLAHAREQFPDDIDAKIIRGTELDLIAPGASHRFVAALNQPSDGTAEPPLAVPRIAQGARREGLKIYAPVAARSIETSAGAVHSVVTERGEIRTSRVVLAGGSWSRRFLGNLDIDLPQQLIASSLLRLSGGTAAPGAGVGDGFGWRQQADGQYNIGTATHVVPVTVDNVRMLPAFLPSLKQTLFGSGGSSLTIRLGADLFRSLLDRTHWSTDEVTPFERVRMLTGGTYTPGLDAALKMFR